VNVIDYGMSASESVSASRFHHQLLPPDLITTSISVPLNQTAQQGLRERGYRVQPHNWEFGDVQLIESISGANGNTTNTGSDPRGIGVSAVIK